MKKLWGFEVEGYSFPKKHLKHVFKKNNLKYLDFIECKTFIAVVMRTIWTMISIDLEICTMCRFLVTRGWTALWAWRFLNPLFSQKFL